MNPFHGTRVLSFESRRAAEMAELIRIQGGVPFVAPSLREASLEDNAQAFHFADSLHEGSIDVVVFLTGVGARYLRAVIDARDGEQALLEKLRRVTVVARGPKPVAVMREWQVPVHVQVPEPNTWAELLKAVQPLPGHRFAVQEYGRPSPALLDGLAMQGRQVLAVPVYQWRLPEDLGPLDEAIRRLCGEEIDLCLFTTGVQIDHLLERARDLGFEEPVLAALHHIPLASIGPTCTVALRSYGLEPAMEPSHPKMGLLVREAALSFSSQRLSGHAATQPNLQRH